MCALPHGIKPALQAPEPLEQSQQETTRDVTKYTSAEEEPRVWSARELLDDDTDVGADLEGVNTNTGMAGKLD